MPRARRLASTLLLLGLALALPACGGSGPDEVPCVGVLDCPGGSPCEVATCTGGRCGLAPRAAGALRAPAFPANCRATECDGRGALRTVTDDANPPDDGNACTIDGCLAGAPVHPPKDAGLACAQDGGTACDGAGACVECLAAADCPGADGECATRTCVDHACGAVVAPVGTPLTAQVTGDCREAVCGDAGHPTTRPLDADLPDDANPCTLDLCSDGMVTHPPAQPGLACPGGRTCDGAGACVQCLAPADCPGTDSPCAQRTCTAGACGADLAAPGTPAGDAVAGDCQALLCDGAGAAFPQPYDADPPVDGNPCTQDACVAGAPSNPPSPPGTPCAAAGGTVCDGAGACVECNAGGDCASGVCAAHACQAATCVDQRHNGAETGVDCGGGACPACPTGQACAGAGDCQSLVCRQALCAAPSCLDGVRNGAETDVDCAGGCPACGPGRACQADADCATGSCLGGTCAAPRVTGTTPAEGSSGAPAGTAVTLHFAVPVLLSSVTNQAAPGACTGTVQLSADDFATCLGFSAKALSGDVRAATLQPAPPLTGPARYRVRTVGGPSSSSYGPLQPYDGAGGFGVAAAGGCGSAVVLSQIYPGGGLAGASYARDFVELHNRTAASVSLAGLSLQVGNSAGTGSWVVTPLSGAIQPGGYLLVQLGGGASGGAALPAPDLTGTTDLSPAGGRVALVSNAVQLVGACPTIGILDLVGYGASGATPTACFEGPGTAPAEAPADAGAALVRAGGGCADGNGNAADLVSQLVVPRNGQSPAVICGCDGVAVNGTGLTVEMDWCDVHFPQALTVSQGTLAGPVWGRVFETGITSTPGAPGIVGQLGVGPQGSDPRYAAGWTFVDATWNVQVGNDDEFQASFTAPAPGSYAYVYRFSPDGLRWTYCDANGAGAGGLPFEAFALPTLTVQP